MAAQPKLQLADHSGIPTQASVPRAKPTVQLGVYDSVRLAPALPHAEGVSVQPLLGSAFEHHSGGAGRVLVESPRRHKDEGPVAWQVQHCEAGPRGGRAHHIQAQKQEPFKLNNHSSLVKLSFKSTPPIFAVLLLFLTTTHYSNLSSCSL